jgi:hypothetical protein
VRDNLFDPIHLPAHEWERPDVLASCRDRNPGPLLGAANHRYGISQTRIAAAIGGGIDQGEVSKLIAAKGAAVTSLERWVRIADAFDMPDHVRHLIGIPGNPAGPSATQRPGSDPPSPTDRHVSYRPASHTSGATSPEHLRSNTAVGHVRDSALTDSAEREAVNRRELIHYSGAALAGAFLQQLLYEPGRMHAALDTSSVSDDRIAEFHHDAAVLGVRVVKASHDDLLPEAMSGFHEVRQLVGVKQTLHAQRALARLGAMFGTVVGEILFNQGQFALAGRWYGVARRAATEADDTYLADIALAGSTYLPMYSADPRGVLDRVTPRLDEHPSASPAISWLWGFKAKAHALLNERAQFQHAVERARTTLDGSAPDLIRPGIFSFLPEKLAFYEARGWVELRDVHSASAAAERALAHYDLSESTEPALVRFERASAFVQAGEITEGCRTATDAVLDPRTYHSITVVTRAREFDRLLDPASQDEGVREWKEVLRSLRPPCQALPAAQLPTD